MKKLLHLFGFHQWEVKPINDVKTRTCKTCGRKEKYVDMGPIGGFSDFSEWVKVE